MGYFVMFELSLFLHTLHTRMSTTMSLYALHFNFLNTSAPYGSGIFNNLLQYWHNKLVVHIVLVNSELIK